MIKCVIITTNNDDDSLCGVTEKLKKCSYEYKSFSQGRHVGSWCLVVGSWFRAQRAVPGHTNNRAQRAVPEHIISRVQRTVPEQFAVLLSRKSEPRSDQKMFLLKIRSKANTISQFLR